MRTREAKPLPPLGAQTPAVMQKYERAAVIGQRAKEISRGAKLRIPLTHEDDAVVIAQKELLAGKITGTITRIHADGSPEVWDILALEIPLFSGEIEE